MSESKPLPTADEFFGSPSAQVAEKPASLPTADEFFKKPSNPLTYFSETVAGSLRLPVKYGEPLNSNYQDTVLSQTSIGAIMNAFGQGAQQGWGEGSIGLSEKSVEEFKRLGIFNDYENGQRSLVRSFNQAFIVPSAAVLDGFFRGMNATIGAVSKGVGETLTQAGIEGGQRLERDINLLASETFAGSPFMFMRGKLPPGADLAEARRLGIIGEPEGVWAGTKEATPVSPELRAELLRRDLESAHADAAPPGGADAANVAREALPVPETTPRPEPTVHEVARSLKPEIFREYDALDARRDTFRRWISELDETRRKEVTAPFDQQITALEQKMEGATKRNAKKYQERIDELASERQKALDALPVDSPDMARIRGELMKTDYAMRDLAPEVSAAYRDARETMPMAPEPASPEAIAAKAAVMPEEAPGQPPRIAPEGEAASPETAGATAERPALAPAVDIAADVRQKLQAAGRPAEEADAAGTIIASHYEARAQRLGTTAQELYARESPEIRQGRERGTRDVESAEKNKDGITYNQDGEARTDTPEFKTWFGNSKVVDKKGYPLEVYHGSPDARTLKGDEGRFMTFKERFGVDEPGAFFFTSDKRVAATYIDDARVLDSRNAQPAVVQAYLSLKNPLILEWEGKTWHGTQSAINKAREAGHDGVIVRNVRDAYQAGRIKKGDYVSDVFIAFFPEQIKSVFNRGTFDPKDPRILYQTAKGKIRLFDDGRRVITLMKDADASTFMHETGHLWLDELMRDAKIDTAVQSLRDDAKAVRKWLGASEDGEITRAQHEKFARGFERYLMEGRAPNAALANVFEQFRQWLVSIYETVAKLRAPITDEIRGVFDRLIAPEREAPVLVETEPARMQRAADRHEAIAANTRIEEAAAQADLIRREADDSISTMPEDYQNAIAGRIIERSERAHAEATGAGFEGTRPPEDAGTARFGEIDQGRGNVAPEVVAGPADNAARAIEAQRAVQREIEREKAPKEKTADPVRATDEFAPEETRTLDKAGNIRIENLNVNDEIAATIREMAVRNEGFIQARRGVLSDAETLELADALGADPSLLDRHKIGQAWNAEEIIAARRMLVDVASDTRAKAQKAADSGIDADLVAYAEARERLKKVQEVVSAITAEAGRSLRAFRALEGMEDAKLVTSLLEETTGLTLYQLRKEAKLVSKKETPQQVSAQIQATRRASYWEMWAEYWINSLFSGPLTHIKNTTSNVLTLVNSIVESGVAGGIGELREAVGLGGKADRVQLAEAKARLYGIFQSAPEAVQVAWKAFRTEEFLDTARTVEQSRYKAIPSKSFEIGKLEKGSEAYNDKIRGMAINQARIEGLKKEKFDARVSELVKNPTQEMMDAAQIKTIEIGGRQIRTFTRFMGATDEMFKAMSARQEINAQAVRIAMSEGKTGDALTTRIAQLTQFPTEAMMEAATKTARYQTFTRELGQFGRFIQGISNVHPAMKLVVPFVRTPINIMKYNAERTPLGALSREIRDNLLGRNGGAAADTQWARLAVGTAVGITVFRYAMDGTITGGGPPDARERALLRTTGWQPYSIKIGDGYYSYSWTPLGVLMGVSADAVDAMRHIEKDQGEKIVALIAGSISKNLTNQTWLKGPSDMIEAVSNPDRYGEDYIDGLVSSVVVPAGVGWLSRIDDPYLREANTILETIKARIPGQSETLLPRRDIWGQPMLRDTPIQRDPVVDRLVAIRYFPSRPERKINGIELTPQQYDDYSRLAGRLLRQRMEAMVALPGFSQAPVFAQQNAMKKAVETSREQAAALIKMQYPAIISQAVDNKLRIIKGEKPIKEQPK